MQVIADFLGARLYIRTNGARVDFNIANLDSALGLVDFFNQYPLLSTKQAQFCIWAKFVLLAQSLRNSTGRSELDSYLNQLRDLSNQLNQLKSDEDV
jgi:LAGLIDADG endonuclease